VSLFTAELDHIPVASASVDLVLTVHAVEPNHGREDAILRELVRVTGRYLLMIEPSYELASAEARERMNALGYVRGLPDALRRIGYEPIQVEAWDHNSNPLNPAALILVDKRNHLAGSAFRFASPISGGEMLDYGDCLYCPDDGHAFPKIMDIPCLTTSNAILASKLHSIRTS
jgi:hypothetical protein